MPLRYTCETTIAKPRDEVVALLQELENLPKWQPGLVEYRHLSGTPGQVGAKLLLRQKMGKREIEITETITESELPARYVAVYEATGVWNLIENTLTETPDGHTHWRVDTEFRCRGITWLMSVLMPGMFRRETEKYMANFKAFAEAA